MISSLFLSQLNRLDSNLFIKLNKELERYIVYRRDKKKEPREVLKIETPQGNFSYPHYGHIVKLYKMDTWQNRDVISKIDEHNDSLDKEGDRHIHYLSDEISKIGTRSQWF